jgi:cytochrome c oxidase subunit 2
MVTYQWLTPTRTGSFDVLCEEFCGVAHHAMRARVVVDTEDDFKSWLNAQSTFAQREALPAGDAVSGQAQYAVCSACHGAQGEGNLAMNAPRLAGLDGWYMKQQLRNYQQGQRGKHPEDTYGQQMAPMAATLPDETAMDNVIAYLATMPADSAPASIDGNAVRGEKLYSVCSSCHGKQGQGVWALNAPRIAGMSDWYLARQLDHFKTGIRGAHPEDIYGEQMSLMARTLADEEAIHDVVAYINTLGDAQ